MAFFGLTTLGPPDPIKEMTATSQSYVFHTIDEARYLQCFDKYLLGDSPTAAMLQLDGTEYILRASLGDMLREVLGRQPRKYELEAWFSYLDFDRSAAMSRSEFLRALQGLKDFSATPAQPKYTNSYDTYRKDWLRGMRVEYEHPRTCKEPMTRSQEIGWHSLKPAPPQHRHHLNHTDVTIREGRTTASYFGHFLG